MGRITGYRPVGLILLLVCACLFLSCTSQEEEKTLKVGDQAPGFTLTGLDGSTVALADYAGSPVVLRFFLTDCNYCRADTPVFNEYYDRYKPKGLKIVYLDSLDIKQDVLTAFTQELAIQFPVALDTGGQVSKRYKVKALPQTVILDPQHKIIAAILGGVSEAELNNSLARYF